MKILLLGGTRFFGRALALQLVEHGHSVTVLTRGQTPVPAGVEHVQADRNDPAALRQAARGSFDAVVDNIAYTAAHVRDALQAFATATGHYVFTSSTAVYLLEGRPPFFEQGAPALPSPAQREDRAWAYTVGKIEAERALFEQDRVAFTVVRPPVVIGPNDPTLRLHFYVQRVADGGPVLLADGGKHLFHLADSADLAAGYRCVLQAGEVAAGKAYNLCQRDVLSLDEAVRAIAGALGREASVAAIPARVLERELPEYPDPFAPYASAMITPPELACRELGFRPRPILEAVAAAAVWHAEHTRKDSAGYAARPAELELARRFEAALEGLPQN